MKKATIFVGLNDKDTKRQEIGLIDAYKVVSNIFVETTGGATISEARGIYTHDSGEIVVETSLRCEVYGAENDQIIKAVQYIKAALNQESVAVEFAEVNSCFM